MIEHLENNTLTQQTIQKILDYIKANGLNPGDFLPTESKMVTEFNVSRVIIREAFSYLKGLGLITSRRGSGFKIAEVDLIRIMRQILDQLSYFSSSELNELFSLRRILEVGAVSEAVNNASDEDLEEIAAAADNLDRVAENPDSKMKDFGQAELRFHRAIMKPANCRMLDIINAALDKYFMSGNNISTAPIVNSAIIKENNREHRLIALAFQQRLPPVALLAVNQHLYSVHLN
jgi:GntR family transcriptional repressor for pyruvate dehydrogenase complex